MTIRSGAFLLAAVTFLTPGTSKAQYSRGPSAGAGIPGGVRPAGASHFARPATPNSSGRPYSIPNNIPTPVGLNPPAASYSGISPGAYKQSSSSGRNFRGGGALIAAPLYYPFLGYDSTAASFPSYNETIDPNAQAFAAAQDSLGEQIRQLSAELASMKQQMYVPPPPPAESVPANSGLPSTNAQSTEHPPVAVVLKSGQSLSVQSYAVMNGFLWDFSKQPVRKIPLSSIDVPASVKATEANGTEFPEITSGR